jgi:hypothetical protein
MLDLDDLLTGLIIEDQNVIPSALARLGMGDQFMDSPEHYAFLPPDAATSVLENIHSSLSADSPVYRYADLFRPWRDTGRCK